MAENDPSMTRRDALSWMAFSVTGAVTLGLSHGKVDAAEVGGPAPGDGPCAARLANNRLLGVRAPMNEVEQPVTRPCILVEDIEAAVKAAARSGAEITVPPMSIPGHGTAAIIYQSGIESGLWQV